MFDTDAAVYSEDDSSLSEHITSRRARFLVHAVYNQHKVTVLLQSVQHIVNRKHCYQLHYFTHMKVSILNIACLPTSLFNTNRVGNNSTYGPG